MHLKRNMMSKGGLKCDSQTAAMWLYACVKARDKAKYDRALKGLRRHAKSRMYRYIKDIPPETFPKHASLRQCWGIFDSNAAETLNNRFKRIRMLTPAQAVAEMYSYIMDIFFSQRLKANAWKSEVSKVREEELRDKFERGKHMIARPSGDRQGVVMNNALDPKWRRDYVVDLAKRQCGCTNFQSNGYPCSHALSLLRHLRKTLPEDRRPTFAQCFEPQYLTATWRATYAKQVIPVALYRPEWREQLGDPENWECYPPKQGYFSLPRGRPRAVRI